MILRIAELKDAEQILAIYSPFILNTPVSYETTIPTLVEFKQRMEMIMQTYPWLVCELNGKVIGYSYASKYRERPAYQWNCECSIYIAEDAQRKGIARKLYNGLFAIMKLQGFINIYAVIGTPNSKSEKFHQAFGFQQFAVYKNTGYKLGEWHDVNWYEFVLNDYSTIPNAPVSFSELRNDSRIIEILSAN